MVQALQRNLAALLDTTSVTSLLGSGAASIFSASDFDGTDALPAIVVDYGGSRKTTLSQLTEDWYVYALDRDYGYDRIAGVLDAVRAVLDGASTTLSGDFKVFEIEWLTDFNWGMSTKFKCQTGGSLFRIYLSKS